MCFFFPLIADSWNIIIVWIAISIGRIKEVISIIIIIKKWVIPSVPFPELILVSRHFNFKLEQKFKEKAECKYNYYPQQVSYHLWCKSLWKANNFSAYSKSHLGQKYKNALSSIWIMVCALKNIVLCFLVRLVRNVRFGKILGYLCTLLTKIYTE